MSPWIRLLWTFAINRFTQCMALCVWLLSPSIMLLRLTHVVACNNISLLFMSEHSSVPCTCHIVFINSLVDRHLDCFCSSSIINNAAMNFILQVFVWICFYFSGLYTRSRIAETYSNSVFKFLRNCQDVSCSVYTILYSTNNIWGFNFSIPSLMLAISHFFRIAIRVGVKWYQNMAWIYIFLMINDVEYFSMCLLSTGLFSLDKDLFKSFVYILIFLLFYHWFVRLPHRFWILYPYQTYGFQTFSLLFWELVS